MSRSDPVARIVRMLDDDAPERRMAAAIVLGELRVKSAAVRRALLAMVERDSAPLKRHALDALVAIGIGKKAVEPLWPLLSVRDEELRQAAARAIGSVGDPIVGEVEDRLAEAQGIERRALESVLAQLGGKVAFTLLLDAIEDGDGATNRATALELRHQIKQASAATRRAYRTRLDERLDRLTERRASARPEAVAAIVKVLGFLEDEKTAPRLLKLAEDEGRAPEIRQEALIALRFATRSPSARLIKALVRAGRSPDRTLAQTALMSLAPLDVPASLASEIIEIALHPELDRARIGIDKLGTIDGASASATLVEIIARGDRQRAELAIDALEGRTDAVKPLAKLLGAADDPRRSKLARRALERLDPKIGAAVFKAIAEPALSRLLRDDGAWREAVGFLASRDPERVAKRLRAEVAAQRKRRKPDAERRISRALVETRLAEAADRYRLASLELADSPLDPRRRANDPAVRRLAQLQREGFDILAALRKDRSVDLEALYYLGFCLLEDDLDGGEELLGLVIAKGGRKKIAKAAKNKLELAGLR